MTLQEAVARACDRLVRAGVAEGEARLDAEHLARHALGWDRATFITRRREAAPPVFLERYEGLVARRAGREPVHLLTGAREFWGLEFELTREALAPRPETEILVEEAIAIGRSHALATIVDVGTGSGCIAVALARELPEARLVATDVSMPALDVARCNARRHGVSTRVRFVRTDLLEAIRGPIDLVVSNPPYVERESLASLPPEVRDHEPRLALDGGAGGLGAIQRLLEQAERVLRPGGWLLVEFGSGQDDRMKALARGRARLELKGIRNDLQNIPRVAILRAAQAPA